MHLRFRQRRTAKFVMYFLQVISGISAQNIITAVTKRLSLNSGKITKNSSRLLRKRQTRTLVSYSRMRQQQKSSALSTCVVCTISLHTAVVTERSGKSGKLPSRCSCNALKSHLIFSKTADRHVFSDPVPRAICVAESRKKCAKNTAENKCLRFEVDYEK